MKKRKEEADRKTEEIMPSVKKWLDEVNAVLDEVQKLQQKLEGGRIKCFNVSLRYSLAKLMDDKAMRMMELINKNNSDFEPFSICTQLPGIAYFSSKEFMNFDSRKSKCNDLLEAIKDGKNKTIGLYGMGGSGKTTLAKEIGKKVNELKLFEKVVMVVVSKSPNVFNIQQEIAEQIGLELKETSQFPRAQRLSLGFKYRKILIILDDVWNELSLEDIGIPLNEGCCVLLTTRLRDVCVSMNCTSTIELTLLTKEEAWALFKMRANTTNVSMNEFDSIGRKIVDECKGLPLAIVTVGSTLKGKSIPEWKSMLRRLQHPPPLDIEDDNLKTSYTILEVSYEKLPNLQAKSLFLFCSIFPEDHEIHIEDLIRFGKGILKLGDNIYTMEETRNEILVTIKKLLDSCLLMNTERKACVKMHDVVRDVALWIGKKKGLELLVDNHAASNMLVNDHQSLKDIKALSLWGLADNFKLSSQLRCPTLEILLLQPHGFIEDLEAIEALKVLALIKYSFTWRFITYLRQRIRCSIPQSIASLTNLHTLCLRGKELGDISFLGELKRLEILDLRGSQFLELPTGIVDMKKLKLLDVYDCRINKSPLEVIERCEQLEELYLWDSKSVVSKNFSLSRLTRYVIIDSTCRLVRVPFWEIFVEHKRVPFAGYFDGSIEALTSLSLQGLKLSDLGTPLKHLILQADYLWLENCTWDHKDINFEIKCLGVLYCKERRTIIDDNILQKQQVFSHLINLRLEEMESLEQVFQNSSITCSLPMLQELRIDGCPKLTTVFSHANITSLPKLKSVVITFCEQLKWLFSYSQASHCPSLGKIIILDCCRFERLIHEEASHPNLATHHEMLFPKLNYLSLVELPNLGEIYPGCEFNLLSGTIDIQDCPNIRDIPLE